MQFLTQHVFTIGLPSNAFNMLPCYFALGNENCRAVAFLFQLGGHCCFKFVYVDYINNPFKSFLSDAAFENFSAKSNAFVLIMLYIVINK